uniref:Uncharacterized protein n=1 Tax=Globodera rostochiensis TaxID=31243 RepID=A0A914GZQ0_GLORO
MELFFFRHAEYERLYNCTGLDIDSIPLERRQFVPESIAKFGVVLSEMGAVQIRIFAQVFLISMINTFAGFLYFYMQNNNVNQWMITLVEFAWLHIHGFPPVIYLAFNKTIRADCRLMFVKLFQRYRIGHIGGVTVVHQPVTNLTNGASPNCEFCL